FGGRRHAAHSSLSPSLLPRIAQRAVSAPMRCIAHSRLLDAIRAENVEYGLPRREQIIRNDAAMASPPHCLGAHDRAAPFVSQGAQSDEARFEGRAQRIIGVIMKAFVLPERGELGRNVPRSRAQASYRRDMLVPDRKSLHRFSNI